ncbi:unnamed protein product [Urochloa humidicola]
MEQPPASNADWSCLPGCILASILCLLEFPDVFSTAAVCTSWRTTARMLPRLGNIYSRPQTPCLLYTSVAGATEMFSLTTSRSYTLPKLPTDTYVADRYIFGSSHGWLVTADGRSELHLFNPATGEQLGLAPIVTIEHVTPVLDDNGRLSRYNLSFYDARLPRLELHPPLAFQVGELREALFVKVVLSCDPSRGDCTAMLIHNPNRQLSFARVGLGGEQWHWVTTSPRYVDYSDCIYHAGAFYAMDLQGGIHRYTIAGSYASCEVIFNDTVAYIAHNVYIAEASSGDLLQIWRFTDMQGEETRELRTNGFDIYDLDLENQSIMPKNNLGDDALFIGHNYTCCLPTKDYPKLLPGHVYFTDDCDYWVMDNKNSRRDVGFYNLENRSCHELASNVPRVNWPNPIWITPSFTKTKKVGNLFFSLK